MIAYSTQLIEDDDKEAVLEVLNSKILTGGKKVDEFEDLIATYVGAKYAVAFSSATAALHGAYFVSEITSQNNFITTPISFVATSNAGIYVGAKPKFCDVKFDGNINEQKIEALIDKETKVITPVDFAGNPCEIEKILDLASKYGLIVIEDSSHALGSAINSKKVGSIADMSIFSFHPVKPITTFEGGCVTTNNYQFYEKLKKFRSHGIEKRDLWNQDMLFLGYNYRLSDVACAIGITQLKKLDLFIQKREEIASFYDKELVKIKNLYTIKIDKSKRSSRHLYSILLDPVLWCQKENIFRELHDLKIGVQVHYKPIYNNSFYKKNFPCEMLQNSEDFYRSQISIPCHQQMSLDDAKIVVECIKNVVQKYSNQSACNV